MTEWDQVRGPFRSANSGDLRDGEDIALFHLPGSNQLQRFSLHMNFAPGDRDPLGIGFMPDIHHAGAALLIEMGKLI